MSAPSAASSPCAKSCAAQRGGAVILAIFTVALAAGVAALLLGNFGHALESASARNDQAQARLLARGAVDWARNVLAEDRRTSNVDHLGEPWGIRVPATPVEEGEVGGEIIELSGRFNLNGLIQQGQPDPAALATLMRLLERVGVEARDAETLADTLAAWMAPPPVEDPIQGNIGAAAPTPAWQNSGANFADPDAPQPPRTPLLHAEELHAVPGFSGEIATRLQPWVAALPPPTRLNVNTASAEVLAASLPALGLDAARMLIAERERAWFRDLADFNSRLPAEIDPVDANRFDVQSHHFLAHGRARYGLATVSMEILLERRDTWPTILWQRIQ